MKKTIYIILPFFFVACAGGAAENDETVDQTVEETTPDITEKIQEVERKSPRTTEVFTAENLEVRINYGSPRVKEREIWGSLVPYDKVWRAGADEATAITFAQNVIIQGNEVPSGTYALFVLPVEKGDWTFILNEEWSPEEHDVWGAFDYKKEKDVCRITAAPKWLTETVEGLTFTMKGNIFIMEWEKAHLEFEIKPA